MKFKDPLYKIEEHTIPYSIDILSDAVYLKGESRHNMGHRMYLKDPKSYSEKLHRVYKTGSHMFRLLLTI